MTWKALLGKSAELWPGSWWFPACGTVNKALAQNCHYKTALSLSTAHHQSSAQLLQGLRLFRTGRTESQGFLIDSWWETRYYLPSLCWKLGHLSFCGCQHGSVYKSKWMLQGRRIRHDFFCRQWLMYAVSVAGSLMSVLRNGVPSWSDRSHKADKLRGEENGGQHNPSLRPGLKPRTHSQSPPAHPPNEQRIKCFPGLCLTQPMEWRPPSVILLCSLWENSPSSVYIINKEKKSGTWGTEMALGTSSSVQEEFCGIWKRKTSW